MNGMKPEDHKRHQAESDLRTLAEAARIRKDKARSEAVAKMAQEQSEAVKKEKA